MGLVDTGRARGSAFDGRSAPSPPEGGRNPPHGARTRRVGAHPSCPGYPTEPQSPRRSTSGGYAQYIRRGRCIRAAGGRTHRARPTGRCNRPGSTGTWQVVPRSPARRAARTGPAHRHPTGRPAPCAPARARMPRIVARHRAARAPLRPADPPPAGGGERRANGVARARGKRTGPARITLGAPRRGSGSTGAGPGIRPRRRRSGNGARRPASRPGGGVPAAAGR